MAGRIEFFFDLSSPWSYLAFHNIRPIVRERDVSVRWRPFLVGGVHNAVNQAYPEARSRDLSSPRWRQFARSLMDWAAWSGVPMNFPGKHFPLRSVHAMRFCCLLEDDQEALFRFAEAGFAAYFVRQENLDDPEVLAGIATGLGLDGEDLRARAKEQPCKDHLRANTDEAIARGAFGAPSIFVPGPGGGREGERLYFGNDQLPLVAWALDQRGAS
ncbi:MAG: 2-hydroxychromene-2-carboxylate isomerase [Myxococcota bacterium]